MGKHKQYKTRYGRVTVTRLKNGTQVVTDAKGNVINVKAPVRV